MTSHEGRADGQRKTERPCPICGRPAQGETRPFCSKRCADVDLHRWLSDAYRIPGTEAGSPDGDSED